MPPFDVVQRRPSRSAGFAGREREAWSLDRSSLRCSAGPPAQDVPELPHVPGPGVSPQGDDRFRSEVRTASAHVPPDPLYHVIRQQRMSSTLSAKAGPRP
jgi:hypothetical protein